MKMKDVVALCTKLGIACESGPLGVSFTTAYPPWVRFRVESGSGIAGRSEAWNVVELPAGKSLGPKVTTRAALRKQIAGAARRNG